MKSGIYVIRNLTNFKFYIGSAKNLDARFSRHKFDFYNNCHHNIHLQRAFNLYGASVFEFGILEYCEKGALVEREQFYIDKYKPQYNILEKAYSRVGSTHSNKTKLKMSIKAKGRVSPRKGVKLSDATKALISASNLDKGHKRDRTKWPHFRGSRCKCKECINKKRLYQSSWRKSKKET